MKNKTIIHTGKFNSNGDELVVFEGVSDGNEGGYFLGSYFVRRAYAKGDFTPKYHVVLETILFFGCAMRTNLDLNPKNAALKAAEQYAGYDSAY